MDKQAFAQALAAVDAEAARLQRRHEERARRYGPMPDPQQQVPYQPMIAARDPRWARVLESIALADEQEAADARP